MKNPKKIVIDLDNTLTLGHASSYEDASPNKEVIDRLKEYQVLGYTICIFTARNMRTYQGNIGKINLHTLPIIQKWLETHKVPHDEILVGKPWCGQKGFYVDDRSIRPNEFVHLTIDEIDELLNN